MFRIAIGGSADADAAQAIGDTVAQALEALAGEPPQAGILLNSGYASDATLLNAIDDTWPGICLTGCAGANGTAARELRLLLFSSPDLNFQLCVPPNQAANDDQAAESMLAELMPSAEHLALYFKPNDRRQQDHNSFDLALKRLMPDHCSDLTPLLPPLNWPQNINRYYQGRRVLDQRFPILIAREMAAPNDGWRFTRTPGILRKQQSESVWIYDTLDSERRRPSAA